MPFDFTKHEPRDDGTTYYRCGTCGELHCTWFPLPDHMLVDRNRSTCDRVLGLHAGPLVEERPPTPDVPGEMVIHAPQHVVDGLRRLYDQNVPSPEDIGPSFIADEWGV